MFSRGKKTGEVGINKEADREIILWITHKILQAIQNDTNTDDLSNLKIHSSEPIQGYSMNDAYRVWRGITLSSICKKFKKAYNSKLFSKSKKYVLPYFVAVENILSNNNPKQLPALLKDFADSCTAISKSAISNKKALFSAFEIKGNGTSTFKSALGALIKKYEKNQTPLQLEEDRKENEERFKILVQPLLTELNAVQFWDELLNLSNRLKDLATCFAAAYLDKENLEITKIEFENKIPENCVLHAYPVLVSIYRNLDNSKPGAAIRADIKAFLEDRREALYNVLAMPEKYSENKYVPECSEIYNLLDTIA